LLLAPLIVGPQILQIVDFLLLQTQIKLCYWPDDGYLQFALQLNHRLRGRDAHFWSTI